MLFHLPNLDGLHNIDGSLEQILIARLGQKSKDNNQN
jgi:hypothetical protein